MLLINTIWGPKHHVYLFCEYHELSIFEFLFKEYKMIYLSRYWIFRHALKRIWTTCEMFLKIKRSQNPPPLFLARKSLQILRVQIYWGWFWPKKDHVATNIALHFLRLSRWCLRKMYKNVKTSSNVLRFESISVSLRLYCLRKYKIRYK